MPCSAQGLGQTLGVHMLSVCCAVARLHLARRECIRSWCRWYQPDPGIAWSVACLRVLQASIYLEASRTYNPASAVTGHRRNAGRPVDLSGAAGQCLGRHRSQHRLCQAQQVCRAGPITPSAQQSSPQLTTSAQPDTPSLGLVTRRCGDHMGHTPAGRAPYCLAFACTASHVHSVLCETRLTWCRRIWS